MLNQNLKLLDNYDAVILGAGPAGLSAALAVASNGKRALVVEKFALPREKVCGGFIGPENQPLLESFGLWNKLAVDHKAQPITHASFTSGSESCEIPLTLEKKPAVGLGILRRDFDFALAEKARERGVTIAAPASWENLQHEIQAPIVIDARGSAAFPESPNRFGVSALFQNVRGIQNRVALHFLKGAQAGINQISPGLFNFCYLANTDRLKQSGGDLEKIFQDFLRENSFLRDQMSTAERVSAWKGIPARSHLSPVFFSDGKITTGDACAFVSPVIGAGITLALWGGWFAGFAAAQSSSATQAVRIYKQKWLREFGVKVQLSKLWAQFSRSPFWTNWILRQMRRFPAIPKYFFEMHHTIRERRKIDAAA